MLFEMCCLSFVLFTTVILIITKKEQENLVFVGLALYIGLRELANSNPTGNETHDLCSIEFGCRTQSNTIQWIESIGSDLLD